MKKLACKYIDTWKFYRDKTIIWSETFCVRESFQITKTKFQKAYNMLYPQRPRLDMV